MGAICEALGLAWPGSTAIPAGDPRHMEVARGVGERIVSLVTSGVSISDQVTQASIENALTVLGALGGSTNAVIHLTACLLYTSLFFVIGGVTLDANSFQVLE